jgi:hypothetical protein
VICFAFKFLTQAIKKRQAAFKSSGMWKQINLPRLRGILVCIQGALRVAYSLSATFNATRNTEQKTSKMADLFISTSLSSFIRV